MADSYDREVVRQETTTGEPLRPVTPPTSVAPVTPVAAVTTSRTAIHREGGYDDQVVAVIWWIVGLIEILIGIRLLLKLFGANPASAFVSFMYNLTWPLVAPFHGIFNTTQEGRSIFEPESIVAMLIFLLIGWGIISLMRLLSRPHSTTTVVD
jgi:uncharacterized membrane protein YphA (DoxX/SURF4 family)